MELEVCKACKLEAWCRHGAWHPGRNCHGCMHGACHHVGCIVEQRVPCMHLCAVEDGAVHMQVELCIQGRSPATTLCSACPVALCQSLLQVTCRSYFRSPTFCPIWEACLIRRWCNSLVLDRTISLYAASGPTERRPLRMFDDWKNPRPSQIR
jgi:hypothetical protein